MKQSDDYKSLNRELWNQRAEVHIDSDFYDMKGFRKGKTSLKEIELPLLGDVDGKTILHVQCHFGQDSLSLARMGARVTGTDISDAAISRAEQLNEELGLNARFICSDTYALPEVLDEQFDIVFTSYGVLGWLPDMEKWAETVTRFLKPGGKLVLVEFHPIVWMYDDDLDKITYSYNNKEVIKGTESGSYASRNASINKEYISWNHGLAEVMDNLIGQGLQITSFQEYDYSPYDCFAHTEKIGESRYCIKHWEDKVPLVYSITATK